MHNIDSSGFAPQGEAGGEYEYDLTSEIGNPQGEAVFNEATEMELAAELLGTSSETELENFLGDLISNAGRSIGGFIQSPTGQALGGILKAAAQKALPIVGGVLGGRIGGPAGANIGSQLASAAGSIFGLELEGLSGEDREFEVARRFVQFAGEATKNATLTPPTADPQAAAKWAAIEAAKKLAPGLLQRVPITQYDPAASTKFGVTAAPQNGVAGVTGRHSGRWFRRGSKIVLMGV
jgi:uncharacterized protein (DUF697 family)